ncbi:MAG: flotillin family protein [Planctomycetota bacterium]
MTTAVLAPQQLPENLAWLLMVVFGVFILFSFLIVIARRYKRCPSNRILVIYGKTTSGRSSKCLHGGGAFVWPLIQNYEYLALDPVQIEIPLQGALSIENIRVNVPSVFTVAIGTDDEKMNNAAVRLLGLQTTQIVKQAEDIILGQLRQVIASMKIEEINRDRDVFLSKVQSSLEPELAKIGLVLINVNIKDITDESGYIEAIGRKAASEAIQQAEIDVALQVKKGAMGVAEADRDKMISVANAEKLRDMGTKEAERERAVRLADLEKERKVGEQSAAFAQETAIREQERAMRVSVADANAKAVSGENKAKADIASANADLKVREAEAYQLGETRTRVAQAAVLEAQYIAQARAAEAQAKKIEAEKRAELESLARAVKAQVIVDAEASAERRKIEALGEAAAIYAKLEAEARGNYEILAKKGEGLKMIVESCGGAQEAFQMLMLEHIEELAKTAAQAISNVKFDKVVVWDGGGGDGKNGTAGFLRGLAGSLPPMMHMMRDIGGVQMPEYFGRLVEEEAKKKAAEPAPATAARSGEGQAGPAKKT